MRKHLSAYTSLPSTSQIPDFIQGIATPISGICSQDFNRSQEQQWDAIAAEFFICMYLNLNDSLHRSRDPVLLEYHHLLQNLRLGVSINEVLHRIFTTFQVLAIWYPWRHLFYVICNYCLNMISKLPTCLMMHVWFSIDNVFRECSLEFIPFSKDEEYSSVFHCMMTMHPSQRRGNKLNNEWI